MRCEVVAVGTELLLGQIVDTNSAWIGEQLALAGIDCHRHTAVGDNRERMLSVIRDALDRADVIIVTGGLGPTQDDITRDVVAEVMGVPMERDPAIVAEISSRFAGRDREMPATNLRQADIPIGARAIAEMPGTAPGLVCPIGDRILYAVPGVPWEMKVMLEGTVLPDLRRRAGAEEVIISRVLRTWGRSESSLAELLEEEIHRLDVEGGPTLAFLASGMEGLKIRITAKGTNQETVMNILKEEEALVRKIVGPIVFGVDEQSMESVILDELAGQGLTLGVAESLTGGMIGSRLTEVPGSSKTFLGSIVAYHPDIKHKILGLPEGPVVSREAALSMADGACRVLGADVSVAVTGVAGPEPLEDEIPGTVWMATKVDGISQASRVIFPFNRSQTRQFTVISVLDQLRHRLLDRRRT